MRKLFQKSWFDIPFSELNVSISSDKLADVIFYEKFYEKFYNRYNSYEDLPKDWLLIKNEIADHISTCIDDEGSILSIGCGIGYIEKQLSKNYSSINIVAIDPGGCSSKWVKGNVKLLNGFFPNVLSGIYSSNDFNFVYASSIDYVFDDKSYINFFSSLIKFGFNDFLLTEIFVPNNNISLLFKEGLKRILSKLHLYDIGQFWGYLRSDKEHLRLLKKAGFTNFEKGRYNHGAHWIRAMR